QAAPEKKLPVLLDLLKDPNPEIRASAVMAISSMRSKAKAAVPVLLTLFDDRALALSEVAKRKWGPGTVMIALSRIGPEAAPGLVAIARNKERAGIDRWRALGALALMRRHAKAVQPDLEILMGDRQLPLAFEASLAYVGSGGSAEKALPVWRAALSVADTTLL